MLANPTTGSTPNTCDNQKLSNPAPAAQAACSRTSATPVIPVPAPYPMRAFTPETMGADATVGGRSLSLAA